MLGMNPRDLRKAMKRLGIRVEELEAVEVVIKLGDGSRLVFESPQVIAMVAKGQPTTYYILGEPRRVEAEAEEERAGVEISEEDVALVAEQAGVSPEEARRALEETGGDIAAAIIKLQAGK